MKEEPDDLTHLAPSVGDDCVPVFWSAEGNPDYSPQEFDLPSLTEESPPQSYSVTELEKSPVSNPGQSVLENPNISNFASVEPSSRFCGSTFEDPNKCDVGNSLVTQVGERGNPILCSADSSNLFYSDLGGIDSNIFVCPKEFLNQEGGGHRDSEQVREEFGDSDQQYREGNGLRNLTEDGIIGFKHFDQDGLKDIDRDQEGLRYLNQEEIINDLISTFYNPDDNCMNNGKSDLLDFESDIGIVNDLVPVFLNSDLNKKSLVPENR